MHTIQIRVTMEQRKRLDALKIHDKQPVYEVIEYLLDVESVYARALNNDVDGV